MPGAQDETDCSMYETCRNERATSQRFRRVPASLLASATATEAVLWGAHTRQSILDAAEAGADVSVFHSRDLGFIGPHGLEIVGRMDLCVKIRGRPVP